MEGAYTDNNTFNNTFNNFSNNNIVWNNKAYWEELTPNEQAAAAILDWTPFSWEEGKETKFSEVLFDELTDIEKTAAKCLGYSKGVWDGYINMVKSKKDEFEERERNRNEWANNDGQVILNEYVNIFKSNYRELDTQYNEQDYSQYFGVVPPPIVRQMAQRFGRHCRSRPRERSQSL